MKLSLLDALAQKMKWHQARQGLLAENIANAETPGYRGKDLKAYGFEDHLRTVSTARTVTAATTDPAHIEIPSPSAGFGADRSYDFEVTPEGNGVTLEDEMMKVSTNQLDYQAVTTLYSRSVRLIRTALGRQA
ncbi:flagellar basal body rod protein FlgB [Devosia sp.]|uniref:flagellar basal body rod protein FlgB n=1 Tax=Devosia sp. TaxID=1871048 RepID=UPI003A91F5D3